MTHHASQLPQGSNCHNIYMLLVQRQNTHRHTFKQQKYSLSKKRITATMKLEQNKCENRKLITCG